MTFKKPTITQFLSYLNREKKDESKQLKRGELDRRQSLVWTEDEENALFFILKRRSYSAVRYKVLEISKRIENETYQTTIDIHNQFQKRKRK